MEEADSLKDLVEGEARKLGFDLFGVCDARPPKSIGQFENWLQDGSHGTMEYLPRSLELRSDPANLLPGVRSIIAVGRNYKQPNVPRTGHPRIAQYALGRDYHKVMRGKLRKLQEFLVTQMPEVQCRVCVDSAPILEREYAQRAGLGWYGKNSCLIDSHRGSWFLIGLLLTTAEMKPSSPATGGCGKCRLCIDACPTGAIVRADGVWQVDARRCISYLTIEHRGPIEPELQSRIGDWTFGCDVCQDVCPFNHPRPTQPLRATDTTEADFLRLRSWPNLQQMAQISEEDWEVLTQGSPVRRAGLEGIRRNAAINLANATREPSAEGTDGNSPTPLEEY